MREFFIANAGYWIDEFHLDGLRLDATQQIFDDVAASTSWPTIGRAACAQRRGGRAHRSSSRENEPQHSRAVPAARARAATASTRCGTTTSTTRAMVALTGRNEAYYTDYHGTPQEFISAAKYGLSVPGAALPVAEEAARHARRSTCRRRRSSPSSRTTTRWPTRPRACGCHELTSPGRLPGADGACCCSAPGTPMLFQGQEFAAVAPVPLLRRPRARAGARGAQGAGRVPGAVPAASRPAGDPARLPDPAAPATFERCKLDPDGFWTLPYPKRVNV